ncbi:MAG: sulfite exporter TauE/SafE family protein [Actinomycetia bacterium]|nr:sulfite exporter TauE/SafE family protein [Actinomycetes bacterium]MCP4960770.1 sulfite exporter TauE/SafE family protein [Actinomycetes bacterium]
MEILTALGVLVLVYLAFTISASAGLGGSLLMVPTLALFLGSKEGVALAALLLASNNVMKIIAYRKTLPFKAASGIVVLIVLGAALGSTLLVNAPQWAVTIGVITMFVASVAAERFEIRPARAGFAPFLAFVSGASSGFSGTSGPLKGVAIRNLALDRRHFVGAASLASFAGDATKTAIFADAELLGTTSVLMAIAAIPLMALGTWTGSTVNERAGERTFAVLFWAVMVGYSVRLGILLL